MSANLPSPQEGLPPDVAGPEKAILNLQNQNFQPDSVEGLKEAFEAFNQATETFQSYYQQLEQRIRELNLELECTNRELEENQHYLSTILDNISAGVLVLDADGWVCTINRSVSQMFGFSQPLTMPCDLSDLFPELAQSEHFIRAVKEQFAKKRRFEIERRDKYQENQWLDVQIVPFQLNGQASKNGALFVIHCITELKRLAHQANLSSRLTAMGEISMNVAHEVRNPLGSIELFSSVLHRELGERPELQQLAGHILTGVRNIDSIVSNILLFAKHQQITAREIDSVDLIEDILVYLEAPIREKSIQVNKKGFANGRHIIGDIDLLKQVFLNLILNAIQAMRPQGHLELAIEPDGEMMNYQIIDDGCGIPSKNRQKIFDAFFTTRDKGTGLGLAIVHRIVKAHQGEVTYSPRSTGGSVFTVSLPLKH